MVILNYPVVRSHRRSITVSLETYPEIKFTIPRGKQELQEATSTPLCARQKDHIWSVVSVSEEQQNQSNPRLLLTLNTDLKGVSTWSRDFSRTPGKLVLFTLVVLLGSLLQTNFTTVCQNLARIALVSPYFIPSLCHPLNQSDPKR